MRQASATRPVSPGSVIRSAHSPPLVPVPVPAPASARGPAPDSAPDGTTANRDAAAFTERELAALLRENAGHPWKPPAAGPAGALAHDVVHGLDITVALGHPRRVPEDRLRFLLDAVTPRSLRFFGADLTGVQLRAQDLDWSHGEGTPVYGEAQDLLLVLFGRRLPPGRLNGGPEGHRVPPTLVA
ncbi:hypothetical protein ACWGIU_19950 [Streptomyces sp. NPDC054840]